MEEIRHISNNISYKELLVSLFLSWVDDITLINDETIENLKKKETDSYNLRIVLTQCKGL